MRCPACNYHESKVVDSRSSDDGCSIRRRRECLECGARFTTYERREEAPLLIEKKNGSVEPFDRNKLLHGLFTATAKRNIPVESLNSLIDNVENDARSKHRNEISSKELGNMVLVRLRDLDKVAYIRFASVYKDFKDLDEFTSELEDMN
ncbi:MAG: transcriptional repressor NrdR [Actinobacteria bacterium]|nr:transcriptional repressor NrdR [Actinomycetota bacterium]